MLYLTPPVASAATFCLMAMTTRELQSEGGKERGRRNSCRRDAGVVRTQRHAKRPKTMVEGAFLTVTMKKEKKEHEQEWLAKYGYTLSRRAMLCLYQPMLLLLSRNAHCGASRESPCVVMKEL